MVGDLDTLTYQLLVDDGALQVVVWLRPLLDPLRSLTDDGFDLPAQLPADVFGHVDLLIFRASSSTRTSQSPPERLLWPGKVCLFMGGILRLDVTPARTRTAWAGPTSGISGVSAGVG